MNSTTKGIGRQLQKELKTLITKFVTEMDETTPATVFDIDESENISNAFEQEQQQQELLETTTIQNVRIEETEPEFEAESQYTDQDYNIPLPEFDSEQFLEDKVKEVVSEVTEKIENPTETFELVTEIPEDETELTTSPR